MGSCRQQSGTVGAWSNESFALASLICEGIGQHTKEHADGIFHKQHRFLFSFEVELCQKNNLSLFL